MHYRSGPGVIPRPLPEVNFLMVEIPTPKPYIFMIRVNRQIKCPKSWGPGSSPSPTELHISLKLCPNVPWVILQSYVRYVWGPKKGPKVGLKWLIILIFKKVSYLFIKKKDQMILTCNSAVASLMLSLFFSIKFLS